MSSNKKSQVQKNKQKKVLKKLSYTKESISESDGQSDGDDNYNSQGEPLYEVEAIRGHKGTGKSRQYQIKWLGYPENQNTWEPLENLQNILKMVKQYDESLKNNSFSSQSSSSQQKKKSQVQEPNTQSQLNKKRKVLNKQQSNKQNIESDEELSEEEQFKQITRKNKKIKSDNNDSSLDDTINSQSKSSEVNSQKRKANNKTNTNLIHDFLEPVQSFDTQKNKQEKQALQNSSQDIKILNTQKVVNNEKKNNNIVSNFITSSNDGRINNDNMVPIKSVIKENSFKSMSSFLLQPNIVPQPLQSSSLSVLSKLTNTENNYEKEKNVLSSFRSSLLIPTAPQNQNLNNIVQNFSQQESSVKQVNPGQKLKLLKLIETPEFETQVQLPEVINPKLQKLNNENQSLLLQLKDELELYKKDMHHEELTDSEDNSDDDDNGDDELERNTKQKRKLKEGSLKIFEIYKELELYKGMDIKTVQNFKKEQEQKVYDNIYDEAKLIEYQQQYILSFNDIIKNIKSIDKNLFRYKLQLSPYVSQNTLSQLKNDIQIQQNNILNPIYSENAYQQQKESLKEQIQPQSISNSQQNSQIIYSNPLEEHQELIQEEEPIKIQQQQPAQIQYPSSLIYEKETTQVIQDPQTIEKILVLLPTIQQEKELLPLIQNQAPSQIQEQVSLFIQENELTQVLDDKQKQLYQNQISQTQQEESIQIQIQESESHQIQQKQQSPLNQEIESVQIQIQESESHQIQQNHQSPLIQEIESTQIQEIESVQIQERESVLNQETKSPLIQETGTPQNKEKESSQRYDHYDYSDDLSNSLSVKSYRRKQSEDAISRNFQTDESEQQILVEDDLDEEQKKILFQNDNCNQKDTPISSKHDSESQQIQNKAFDSEKEIISQELPIQICLQGLSNNMPQQINQEIKRNKSVFDYDSLSSSVSIDEAQKMINQNLNSEQKQDLEMNLIQTKNLNLIELKQNTPSNDSKRTDNHLSDSLSACPNKEKCNNNFSNKSPESQKAQSYHKSKKQENSSINSMTSDSDRGSYHKNQNMNKSQKKKGEGNPQNPKYSSLSSSKSQSSSSTSNYSRSSSSSSEKRYKKKKFNKSSYSQSRSSSIDQRKSNNSSRSSASKDDFFKKQAISSQSSIDHSDQRILNKVNFKLQANCYESDDQSIKKDNSKKVENTQNQSLDQQTKVIQPEQQKQQDSSPQNQNSLFKDPSKEVPIQSTQKNQPLAIEAAPKLINPQTTDIQLQPKITNQDHLFKTASFEPKPFFASQLPQSVVICSLFEPIGNIQTNQQAVSSIKLQPIAKIPAPLPQPFNKNSLPQTNSQNPLLVNNVNTASQNKEIPTQHKITNPPVQIQNINAPQVKSSIPATQPTNNNSQSKVKKQIIQQDKKIKTVKPENPFGIKTVYDRDEESSSDESDSDMDEEINPKQQKSLEIQQQTSVKNTVQLSTVKNLSVNQLQKQDSANTTQQNTLKSSSVNVLQKYDSAITVQQNTDKISSVNALQKQDLANVAQQNTDKISIVNTLQKQDSVKTQNPSVELKKQVSNSDNQSQSIKNVLEDQSLKEKQNSIQIIQEDQHFSQKYNSISQIPLPLQSVQITPQAFIQNIENIKDPRIKKKFEQQEKKNQNFDSKLNTLKNNVILFSSIGSLKFDTPERIISHLYHNGQLFFKVSWKPREDKIQMPPTFIEYFKLKDMYPVICDKYIIPILSSQLIKY
ncbi:hypothetical protein ABPG72_006990 [Tetrahymena utriculariae]